MYELHPGVKIIPGSNGSYLYIRNGRAVRFPAGLDVNEVLNATDDCASHEVFSVLSQLVSSGMTVSATWREGVSEYDTRLALYLLAYLGDPDLALAALGRLRTAWVVVMGVGGVGGWLVAGLSGLGIRRLSLVDFDVVEPSNLNRSALFGISDIGQPKIDAAASWIRRAGRIQEINAHDLHVRGSEKFSLLFNGRPDLILATLDVGAWRTRESVGRYCVSNEVPFMFLSGSNVGPLWTRIGDACARCLGSELVNGISLAEWSEQMPFRGSNIGSAPGPPMMAASVGIQAATECLAFGGKKAVLRGHVWHPTANGGGVVEPVAAHLKCPSCGS